MTDPALKPVWWDALQERLDSAGPRAQVVMHPTDREALYRYLETIDRIIVTTSAAELIHRDGVIDGRVQRSFFKIGGTPLFTSEHAEVGRPVLMEPVEPRAPAPRAAHSSAPR